MWPTHLLTARAFILSASAWVIIAVARTAGTFKDETTCGLENSFGVQMPCVKPQWGGGATCTCCTDYYELGCVKYSSPTPSPTLPPVATSPPSPALGVSLAPKDGATSVTAQQVLIVTTSSSARLSGTPSADRALLTLTSATEGWQLIETSHQFYDTTGNTVANSIASPALETATFAEVHVTVVWVPPDDAGALRAAGNAAVAAGVLDADGMSGNEATASISIGYDGDDPEITFLAPQVEGGVSSDRVLAVEMRVSEAAYGWSWGNVSASGCTLSFPAPSLRVTMDGATSFTAVVTISERGGDAVLAVPEGAFTDAAGRPNKAAKLSVRHSPTWAENISTASTTVTATSVGAAAASSVVASAAASASVVSGGVGAAGGAGVVSGMGVGAGGGGGGFVGAGSNVAGPGQLSGVVQAHILSMVAHVQFVSVLSSLRGSLPEGFRTFGTGLEWTNLDFEGLPWDVETAPGTADTSEAGSATRRLAWKGEGVAGARAGTCPGMRGFDAQSGMEMWLLRGSRTRGLTETNTGDQSEDIAAEDSVVLQALNSLTEESVTDDEAWASYYTRLLVGALAVGGAAILRRGFVSVWGWWRRRKGEDEETIEAKMPAMALFPKAELMAFAATMTGVCNGSGGIIGTGQAVGIAVGSLTVVLWATPFVWFVTHVVILRWIIREKRAEFVVEEDELGNQKDGLSVAHIPGEWREADPKARFLERYGHLFSQHAGNSGAESKWVEARREARRRKRESRQAERKAKEAKSIRVKIRPEDALPDTEDPNAEFMGPSAASGRRGRVQVVSTARHWRGGVDREKPEGEEEEEVELRGAGWLRRWMLVMLVPFNVLPYEVRLFHWTVVTCKTIFVAVLSGMSALFPKTAPLVIAAITVAHALFTFVWLPFTDFAELLIELLSVSIEALTTVLVAWMSINESLLESDAVDGALVALSMTMLISHMGYQVYMMVVIRMMTQLYKDAQVMTEQKAMEMEKEMREDDAALNEARGGKVATATQVLTAKPLDSKRSKSRWDGVKVEDDDL